MIIGDTGEQDASQYVVCPSLSAAVREHRPGFVLIASDVIYPAGDVDDYSDGVYRPYRSPDPHFRVDAPLLGLPGNHDWYDGLAGFMYHFAEPDRLPAAAYAPRGCSPRAMLGRLSRILWRRATRAAARRAAALREPDRPGWASTLTRDDRPARALLRDPDQAPAGGRHRHRHRRAAWTAEQWEWLTRGLRRARSQGPDHRASRCWSTPGCDPCWVGAPAQERARRLGLGAGQPARSRLRRHHRRRRAQLPAVRPGPRRRRRPAVAPGLRRRRRVPARHPHLRQRRPRLPGPGTTRRAPSTPCPPNPSPPATTRSATSPSCWCPGVRADHGSAAVVPGRRARGRDRGVPAGRASAGWYAASAGALAVVAACWCWSRSARSTATSPGPPRWPGGWSASAPSRSACSPPPRGISSTRLNFRSYLLVWLGFTALHCVVGAADPPLRMVATGRRVQPQPDPVGLRGRRAGSGRAGVRLLFAVWIRSATGAGRSAGALLIIVVACGRLGAAPAAVHRSRVGPSWTSAPKTVLGRRNRRWHLPAHSWCPPCRP